MVSKSKTFEIITQRKMIKSRKSKVKDSRIWRLEN